MKKSLFKLHLTGTVIVWTALVSVSLLSNIIFEKNGVVSLARNAAETTFNKDQAIRFWATAHGGVYVPVTPDTQPNVHLSHVVERDIVVSDEIKLTLMNPAYMLRQMLESQRDIFGIKGHITSLKPLRPENAPNEWEITALESFENGADEFIKLTEDDGVETFRFMRPMITTEGCLKCHSHQGYQIGDVRGGVSVEVPLSQYRASSAVTIKILTISHLGFWLIGLLGITFASNNIKLRVKERQQAMDTLEEQVENRTVDLKKALDEVKHLQKIIPICCHCKKIRTDEGIWEQIEIYISDNLDSDFSHGICPECMKKHYPEFNE
ncbi:DUF3365 domain-containing protein [Candidatus Latescibacterota bacterium]